MSHLLSKILAYQTDIDITPACAAVNTRLYCASVSTIGSSNYTSGMPSMGIGMFNFLFILFGLATIFNTTRASEQKKVYIALASICLTLVFGVIYLLKMSNQDNVVNYSDVGKSVNLMIVSIVLYIIGAAYLLYELFRTKKEV